jgi:hypothetical protein
MHVMVAMMSGPPQRSALNRGRSDHGEYELSRARGAKAAVCEITMIEGGHGEHAYDVKSGRDQHGRFGYTDPDHAQTAQMQAHKWNDSQPVDGSTSAGLRVGYLRIDPSAQTERDSSPNGTVGARAIQRSSNRGVVHFSLLLVYCVLYVPGHKSDAK